MNLLDIYTDFKNKVINKSGVLRIILPIIEEHDDELLRLQAIDLLTTLNFKDKQLFKFFEHLIISDINEKIRNAALIYLCKHFSEKSGSLFKWVINHETSYSCQITLLQSFQKQDMDGTRKLLLAILNRMKKVKFLNQDKQFPNHKYRIILKSVLKSQIVKNFSVSLLSEIIINFFTLKHLINLFPNVFFELNPENVLIERLDLSDYLEYEVKGTPWGWKNNIDTLSKIEGLVHLKNLKQLDLSNNLLKNVEGIVALENLTHLNLMNNQIDDIRNLNHFNALPNLKYLNLEGNPICKKLNSSSFKQKLEVVLTGKYLEMK